MLAEELPAKISTFVDSVKNQSIHTTLSNKNLIFTNEQSTNAGYSKSTLWTKIELPAHKLPIIITIEKRFEKTIEGIGCRFVFDSDLDKNLRMNDSGRKYTKRRHYIYHQIAQVCTKLKAILPPPIFGSSF